MKKGLNMILLIASLVLYFWYIVNSTNIISALGKVLIVAFLLLGMENGRRTQERTFLDHSNEEKLRQMSERELKEYVSYLYKKLGYFIDLPKKKEGLAYSIVARKRKQVLLIRCVSGEEPVDKPVLEEVNEAQNKYKNSQGMIVATSGFTQEAKEFAKVQGIELVDQEQLIRRLEKVDLGKHISSSSPSTQQA